MKNKNCEYNDFMSNDFKSNLFICGASMITVIILVVPWVVGVFTLGRWILF